ncbi:MAG TPA: methylmalonyl-CoA mutase family protein, partial [Candidatus Binatia bacterium]|nr:methylmalonyl-CoA mutase family protein [Candidatus Binatia bacterium]
MSAERRTVSGIPLLPVYGPEDVPASQREASASRPGAAPFLRGAYPQMYRTKPWRIFQLSGYGNPEDENERIKFLLANGETGFIMEHDRMTADHLYDVDHPEVAARREDVGLTGAVMLHVRDFELALDGIDQGKSYAHPGGGVVQHAPYANAGYWTVARRRGLDLSRLAGTGQSDYFLTYVGCFPKEQIPARAGLRLNRDLIEFCAAELPRWVPVSIAAYNGADTGLNAWQELGALFANAVEYLDLVRERRRLPVATAARAVGGVSFRVSMELFEDIAKLRAARKMWHDLLRERYGVDD